MPKMSQADRVRLRAAILRRLRKERRNPIDIAFEQSMWRFYSEQAAQIQEDARQEIATEQRGRRTVRMGRG